jgi:predicted HTH domain antitoxin
MTITIQVSDELLHGLALSREELTHEINLAAAIHLYNRGLISQGKGAELAGLSRRQFIDVLSLAKVSVCQTTAQELAQEVNGAVQTHGRRLAADLTH